jgi:hypothetical protein
MIKVGDEVIAVADCKDGEFKTGDRFTVKDVTRDELEPDYKEQYWISGGCGKLRLAYGHEIKRIKKVHES